MRKKLLIMLMVMGALLPQLAFSYDFEVGGIRYNLINDHEVEVGYNGDVVFTGRINIPSRITYNEKEYSVSRISAFAFLNNKTIIEVSSSVSVDFICWAAFYHCDNLEKVTIWGYTTIDSYAFSYCSNLKSVRIYGQKYIGEGAFSSCPQLASVEIVLKAGDNMSWGLAKLYDTYIGTNAFGDTPYLKNQKGLVYVGNTLVAYNGDKNITDISIAEGTLAISDNVFEGCESLENIDIPSSVQIIGSNVFEDTPWYAKQTRDENGLVFINNVLYKNEGSNADVVIPEGTVSIASSAFEYKALSSVVIPEGVKYIGDYAFTSCNFTELQLPNSVECIGEDAFNDCDNLTSVSIPEGCIKTGMYSFAHCASLESVLIPSTLEYLGDYSFMSNEKLLEVSVSSDNPYYTDVDGVLYNKAFTKLLYCPAELYKDEFTIPDRITTVEMYAFHEGNDKSRLTIPASVKTVGIFGIIVGTIDYKGTLTEWLNINRTAYYFPGGSHAIRCGVLLIDGKVQETITIPNDVTCIKYGALSHCGSLKKIIVPDHVTTIQHEAFWAGPIIDEVIIGKGVTNIGDYALNGVKKIVIYAETPPALATQGGSWFDGLVYVPAVSLEAYKAADEWKDLNIQSFTPLDETVYLYNEESGMFLERGNNWGTHATVGNYGLPVNIKEGTVGYTLSMLDWEGTCIGFDGDIYTDAWGDNARTYTATYKNGGFVFTNNNGYVMTIQGTDVNGVQGSEGTVWKLLNQEERDAILAAKAESQMAEVLSEGGMSATDGLVEYDCTDKVASASLKNGYEGWTWTYVPSRGSASNLRSTAEGFECWEGAGKLTQTVTGLEPGLYKVSVNALYRDGSCDKMNTLAQDGYNISTAYIAANGYSAQVTPWYVCRESDGYPNTMGQFATMVSADPTKYLNEVITYVGNDGVLELELVCTQYINGGWLMASDLKLARLKKEIHLVDGTSFHNDTEDEFETIKYTRNFKNTKMQALFVPFELSYDDWADNFVVYTLNNVTQYDTDGDEVLDATNLYVNKVKEGHTLKANHPYIIKAINTGEYTFSLSDATLYPSTDLRSISCSTLDNEYIFQGTYTPFSGMYEQGGYALANGQMSPASSPSATLNPYRWYMTIRSRDSQFSQGNVQEAKSFRIVVLGEDEDEETVITDLAEDAVPVEYVGVNGLHSTTPLKGMNIVKMSDGSTRKMYIK